MAEGYAIFSEDEIKNIKEDISTLKRNPLGGSAAGKSLMENVEVLNKSINDLISIFKEASDQMKLEDRETDLVSKKIDPLFEKLDMLIEQNQKIARGIVAVADMVSEALQQKAIAPKPIQPQIPQPMPRIEPEMPRIAPPPMPEMPSLNLPPVGEPGSFPPPPKPMSFGGLPPLTPPKRETKGLFGLKK
jgi:hypothetical protein